MEPEEGRVMSTGAVAGFCVSKIGKRLERRRVSGICPVNIVRVKGLEPIRTKAPDPKSGLATNYNTPASAQPKPAEQTNIRKKPIATKSSFNEGTTRQDEGNARQNEGMAGGKAQQTEGKTRQSMAGREQGRRTSPQNLDSGKHVPEKRIPNSGYGGNVDKSVYLHQLDR